MLHQFHLLEKDLLLMSRFPQPCSVCGKLTKGKSKCEQHEKEYQQARGMRNASRPERQAMKSKLYNYAYRQEAKRVRDTATHCHICKQPFMEGDKIEADHLIAGLIGGPLAPAHRRCNQSRGDKPIV